MGKIAAFEVLDPGVLTSLQDLGRYGYIEFGVPPSGALDPFSFRAGNLLVGNNEDEACLEVTLTGLRLLALREGVIAITGADLFPTLNGEPLEMWRTHLLVEGDVIAFRRIRSGCRSYFAVQGGFAVPRVMESRSTYLAGKFGGLGGRPLRRDDVLCTAELPSCLDKLGRRFPKDWIPSWKKEVLLRVIPGPQDDHFSETGFETFYSSLFQVTPQCDRMGIRLDGPEIERRPHVEESIISEGLLPGAIQVPGDGKPFIILTETVTGGYAKIAGVISIDLPKVAQIKPGDRVRFEPISIQEAHALLREQEEQLRDFKNSLEHR